jgi:Rieske Fe-S protein
MTPKINRRAFLRAGFVCGAALAQAAGGIGCRKPAPPAIKRAEVPLSQIIPGRRVTVRFGMGRAEVFRDGERIVARSLVCPHTGCNVLWVEKDRHYRCTCHEGRFDDSGRPIAGPPPRPLETLPYRIEGPMLILGA